MEISASKNDFLLVILMHIFLVAQNIAIFYSINYPSVMIFLNCFIFYHMIFKIAI